MSKVQPSAVEDTSALGKVKGDFSAATIGQKTVCVTGASGYIAGWCVKYLLDLGHKVKGSVRKADGDRVTHLNAMQNGNLEIVEGCDLTVDGSFDKACEGCDVVMHTASPFELAAAKDPNAKFVTPALEGTKNVLNSCKKAGVKTVVQTSSVVAVYGAPGERGVGHVFTEEDWNLQKDPNSGRGYSYSKKVAEKAAIDFVKENGDCFKLVSINPGLVTGPSTSARMNGGSLELMSTFLSGKNAGGAPKVELAVVDVRDVAWAHIAGAFNPAAQGRYITIAKHMTMLEIGAVLAAKYKKQPKSEAPKCLLYCLGPLVFGITCAWISENVGVPLKMDNSKIKADLLESFTDVDASLLEAAEDMVSKGLVKAHPL